MGQGRTRDVDAEHRILDATFELISTRGAGAVGIDEIAAAANVGKQTIYRWWPSRTAVVVDALLRRTVTDTPFAETGDTRADLRDHLQRVVKVFSSPTGALIREVLADAQSDADTATAFRERFWQPRRDLSAACLRAGIERGQVRDDIDIDTVLDALYGPIWLRLLIGHRRLRPAVVDHTLGPIWRGITATTPPHHDGPGRDP